MMWCLLNRSALSRMYILKKHILHIAVFYSQTQTAWRQVSNHTGLHVTHMMQPTRHLSLLLPLPANATVTQTRSRPTRHISGGCVLGTGTGCLCRAASSSRPRPQTKEALFRPRAALVQSNTHCTGPWEQDGLWGVHTFLFSTQRWICLRGSASKGIPARFYSHRYNELLF